MYICIHVYTLYILNTCQPCNLGSFTFQGSGAAGRQPLKMSQWRRKGFMPSAERLLDLEKGWKRYAKISQTSS